MKQHQYSTQNRQKQAKLFRAREKSCVKLSVLLEKYRRIC
jgi:hypothetical protein